MKRIITHNISRSAGLFPNHIAFKQLDQSLNYLQLFEQSNQLANFLVDIGIKKGERIGVFMNRSFESAISIYGIMRAGAAYVPIDSNLPINKIIGLINDCEINVLISKPQFKKKLDEISNVKSSLNYIIGLEENESNDIKNFSWNDVKDSEVSEPSVDITEDDIAYIIYTSGTTGKPKGIVHTHYSGQSYAKLSAELYNINQSDILGNHSQLHFDISTLGYLTMPYVGGCTIIVPEAHTKFPVSLGQLIEKEKMTIWYSVPLALIQLLKSGAFDGRDFSALRWVLFGGEIFAIKYFEKLFNFLPQATFSNVYGPAEVNQCTYYNFDKNTELGEHLPLGKAWPETKLELFESTRHENEQLGELMVSSSTLMKGYWNQDALTTKSILTIENPNEPSETYYKTGDLVRKLANDELIFVGRKDRQIKVRGHRVELNEIETIILSNNSINETAVYAKKHEDAFQIYADIVFGDLAIDILSIKKYLSKHLPSYAVPENFKIVESIPRTGAGKVDYKFLSK